MQSKLFASDHCLIGPQGELIFNGVSLGQLARKLDTPFYLISESILEDNYRRFFGSFSGVKDFAVYYSVKTNFETEVLRALQRLGAGLEISGDLDLQLALKAGFEPNKIVFDGPCKTERELELAAHQRVHLINAESVDEIGRIDSLAQHLSRMIDIGVRVDPMTRRPYYDKVITTYKQKFGFPIDRSHEAIDAIRHCGHIRLAGINAHIGSQILSPGPYVHALNALFRLAASLRQEGFPISEINIGGGFPAQSMRNLRLSRRMRGAQILERFNLLEKPTPSIEQFGEVIANCYRSNSRLHGFAPRLTTEPGRSLVNNACVLLGSVQLVKSNWVFTDISINNVPENLFFSERRIVFPDKMLEEPRAKAHISGPTLATNDVLFFEKEIPQLAPGDPVALFDTGAYSIPRANQFTRPRPAVYFLNKEGKIRLIRRRETVEDVLQMQLWEEAGALGLAAAVGAARS